MTRLLGREADDLADLFELLEADCRQSRGTALGLAARTGQFVSMFLQMHSMNVGAWSPAVAL